MGNDEKCLDNIRGTCYTDVWTWIRPQFNTGVLRAGAAEMATAEPFNLIRVIPA